MFVIKDGRKKLYGSLNGEKPVWMKTVGQALEYDYYYDAVIDCCDLFNGNGVVVEVA